MNRLWKANKKLVYLKEGLIKSAGVICERFFAAARRDFAGIIVFIARNHNEAGAEKICKAPQTHLISASLNKGFRESKTLKHEVGQVLMCGKSGTAYATSSLSMSRFL